MTALVPCVDRADADQATLLDPDDCTWPLSARAREAVGGRMGATIRDVAGPLAGPAGRIAGASGKMLRPALALTVAALGGSVGEPALAAATAVELLHAATLVHDDLIDGADRRRGVPTVHAVEGLGTAVVTGDVLIAASFVVASRIGPTAPADLAATLADLCAGQQLEDRLRFDVSATPADALTVARYKTASLMRAACLLGATGAGLPGPVRTAVAGFGEAFGLVLQIVDDLLDVVSSADRVGKPVCADLEAGTVTVPIAWALRAQPRLAGHLAPDTSPAHRRAGRSLVLDSDAVGASVRAAAEQVRRAEDALRAVEWSVGPDSRPLRRLRSWPAVYLRSLADKTVPELRAAVHAEIEGALS